jgi:hypothetical protein
MSREETCPLLGSRVTHNIYSRSHPNEPNRKEDTSNPCPAHIGGKMSQTDPRLDYIRLLFRHEVAISKIYEACEKKFPDHAAFWAQLKVEEVEHGEIITKLFHKLREGPLKLNERRFKRQALQKSLAYLDRCRSAIHAGAVSLTKALSLARDLEHSLLEKKYFEVFDSDSVELQQVFLFLQYATQTHLELVKEALAQSLQRPDAEKTNNQALS